MRNKAIVALVGYLLALGINFVAVQLPLNGMTPPELSDLYPNLFVPANVTFSIWSIIYLGLLVYVINFFRQSTSAHQAPFDATHPLFFISCLLNAAWIICWHYLLPEAALIIMVALLVTLLKLYFSIRSTRTNSIHYWIVAIPFSIYTSWICVAL
nr:hypothetical protein [Saprospiraceae bacterium]